MRNSRAPFFIMALLLLALVMASISLGAVDLSWAEIWLGLMQETEHSFTLIDYRLPRILLAILVGALLALAGTLAQGVIHNPLASPDILGVSHGAGLFAVLWIMFAPGLSVYWLPLISLVGGLLAATLLFVLCRGFQQPIKLSLTGVALSALFAGTIDFLLLTHPLDANNALLWLTGSLWGRNWQQIWLILPSLILVPLVLFKANALNVLALGDQRAINLGIRVNLLRIVLLSLCVIWTSACVAVCGPITFLGLVAPHLARQIVGGRHQRLIPGSMLIGANLLLAADLVARVIDPPLELTAGVITAILGAPYFLYLLMRLK